jgi:cobyrinic acid a,c-diamide synthase
MVSLDSLPDKHVRRSPPSSPRGRGLTIAAAASGSGKTLVTAGLLRHFRGRGVTVAAAVAGRGDADPLFSV